MPSGGTAAGGVVTDKKDEKYLTVSTLVAKMCIVA